MAEEVDKSMTPWYHGNATKETCNDMLLADGGSAVTGKFLFRASAKASVVLSVIFKGKVTHHQITEKKGVLTLNGKPTPCTTLRELATFLREPRGKAWPLALTEGVPGLPVAESDDEGGADDAGADDAAAAAELKASQEADAYLNASRAKAAAEMAAANAAAAAASAAAAAASDGTGESAAFESGTLVDAEMTPFYHGDISDANARELLSVTRHGGAASGNFLYGKDGSGFNLWVLHEGNVKQHKVTWSPTKTLLYNGNASGAKNLAELTDFLSASQQEVFGGSASEERNRIAEFEKKVQASRSKQANEDVVKNIPKDIVKKPTVAGWPVKLTTGVRGYRVRNKEEEEAAAAAAAAAAEADRVAAQEREKAEIKAYQEEKKRLQRERLEAEVRAAAENEQMVAAELNSEELQKARAEAEKKIEAEKRRKNMLDKDNAKLQKKVESINRLTAIAQSAPVAGADSDSDSDDEGGGGAGAAKQWTRRGSLKEHGKSGGIFDFVWAPMATLDAYAWLQHGGVVEGKFLVRHVTSNAKAYYLDVIIDGRPTTHDVVRPKAKKNEYATYRVDKVDSEQSSIELVIKYLQTQRSWWHTPLTACVEPITDPKEAKAELKRIKKERKSMKK